ncbi:MAG: PEP-CTERM sorting domain-containing protein [Burkholderiaceae bacterium]
MIRHSIASAVVGTALSAVAFSASAAPVTFFGQDLNTSGDPSQVAPTNSTSARNAFFGNLQGVGTETFESFPSGATPPLAVTFPGAGTATLTGAISIGSGNDGSGRYAISGSNYVYANTDSFNIAFSAPIAAFGFYGIDIGDFGGQLSLSLTDVHGITSTIIVPNTIGQNGDTSGSVLYFGFYDTTDTYTSISFNDSTTADVFGFDDFSIGSNKQVVPTIPEPSSWLLMALGLAAVGFVARRRGSDKSTGALSLG